MKIFSLAIIGALAIGICSAQAQGPGGPMGGGMGGGMGRRGPGQGGMMGGGRGGRMMPPAMMMKDADMKVENTSNGVIIRYTSSDPEIIKKVQENAKLMKERHDSMRGDKKPAKPGDKKDDEIKDGDKAEPKKDAAPEKPKSEKPKDKK